MKDGNAEILQGVFDLETARRRYILEIDTAEHRFDQPAGLDDLFRVLGVQADRPGIDLGKFAEQERLAFHHRKRRPGADIAEAEHRRAVAHDGNGVSLDGELTRCLGIRCDHLARPRHPRRVGQRQVVAAADGELVVDANLTAQLLVQNQ